MTGLQKQLARYDAILTSVEMSDYGYWVVTYSVAPCLSLSVTVCQTGINSTQAAELGQVVLASQTGQKVRQ